MILAYVENEKQPREKRQISTWRSILSSQLTRVCQHRYLQYFTTEMRQTPLEIHCYPTNGTPPQRNNRFPPLEKLFSTLGNLFFQGWKVFGKPAEQTHLSSGHKRRGKNRLGLYPFLFSVGLCLYKYVVS